VLLAGEAPDWIAKIADFGLLKDMDATQGLTGGGIGLGSPGYMAPEQYTDAANVTHLADLFSAGAVLFELLAGRRAFPGGTVVEQFRAAAQCEYTEPERVAPGLPPGRYAAIRRALVPEPSRRIQSATEMLILWTSPPEVDGMDTTMWLPEATVSVPALTVPIDSIDFTRPRAGNLPPRMETFVGRVEALHQLSDLLKAGRRLLSILGPGGSGKTAFAQFHAHRVAGDLPGGAWFCDCAEARGLDDFLAVVGGAMDLPTTGADPVARLADSLRLRGPSLVILDNLEHLIDDVGGVVAGWVARAPDLQVLVTSRIPLRQPGEQLLPLGPLDCPPPYGELWTELPRYAAIQLFVARAREVMPKFELSASNADDVAAIVRELDGMPLAIELAAARVRMMAPRTILQRLNRRFDLLRGHAREADDKVSTLRGAIDGSWELLSPPQQRALGQCSVFGGQFSLDAAEAVIDAGRGTWTVDVLEALVDHSVIRRVEADGETRFALPATIRAYAEERLGGDPGDREAAELRHGAFYAASVARREDLEGPDGVLALRRLALDRDNLQSAAERALGRGDATLALPLASALASLAAVYGPVKGVLELVNRAARLPGLGPADRALLALRRAELLVTAGSPDAAAATLEHATPTAEASGDPVLMADLLGELGIARRHLRRFDEADAALERARELHLELGLRAAAAIDRLNQGNVAYARQDLATAARWFEQAMLELRRYGNRRNLGVAQGNLGTVQVRSGDAEAARRSLEEALASLDGAGDRRAEGTHRLTLGVLERREGRLDEAAAHFAAALTIARQLGDQRLLGRALAGSAQVATERGQHSVALDGLRPALDLHRQSGNRRSEALTWGNVGDALLAMGRPDEAVGELKGAVALCAEIGLVGPRGAFLGALGEALARTGDARGATAIFEVGERLLIEADEPTEHGKLLARRGRFLAALGARRQAELDLEELDRLATSTGGGRDVELTRSAAALRAVLAGGGGRVDSRHAPHPPRPPDARRRSRDAPGLRAASRARARGPLGRRRLDLDPAGSHRGLPRSSRSARARLRPRSSRTASPW
jgi:predicted ATPase/Tfp pilus assembly protein PilF